MTVPDRAIHAALAKLDGQWVEAVDPAPRPVLVTSGAAVLRGALRIPTEAPTRDDARVLGAHLAGSALAADGSLSLHLADADGSRPLPLTVDAPWDLALPDGAGLTAAAGGRVTAPDGSPLSLSQGGSLLATNGRLHSALLTILKE